MIILVHAYLLGVRKQCGFTHTCVWAHALPELLGEVVLVGAIIMAAKLVGV